MLKWRGDAVRKRVANAVRLGIDDTLVDAVPEAKRRTPVVTGLLQGSIMAEPARVEGGGGGERIRGRWGSFDVEYALPVEVGTSRRQGRFMLRQAADLTYPELSKNIRTRLDNG